MKKIKKSMLVVAIFSVVIISATGCDKKPVMNADKCAEVALEYMENKYQKDFEVADSRQMRKYIGSDNYARVIVKIKGEEEEFWIILYPDGDKDIDNDGYYDSYKVISDDYMSELVKQNILKREFDNLSNEMGVNRYISDISVYEICQIKGFCGFASNFYIENENNTLDGLLKNANVCISYRIEVPESEFNQDYEKYFKKILKPKMSDDSISISIVSYSEETYLEREKIYKEKGYEEIGGLIGKDEIDFFIEEETNESK